MDDDESGQITIKPISVETVHKICSGQVVLSLAIAVKELIENSLDAGATNIEIRLKNYGTELIEVSDNGSGVSEENFAALTLKYHTSKLNEYSDLLGITSFGFRGEALSSLCALSNLSLITRHKDAEYATKIEYDHKGNIVKKIPCARQVGTTVSLTNLFCSLPVRYKEFHKNAKREFNKMTQLLYAYCLISLGVKITCSHQTNSNNKILVVATQGTSYRDNIACVFGSKQLQSILEIKPIYVTSIKKNIIRGLSGEVEQSNESMTIEDVDIDLSEDSNEADSRNDESLTNSQKSQGHKNIVSPIEFNGFVSSCAHGAGRSSTDRQFFYVNSRPCEPAKVIKLLNEIYRQYNPNQYPFVFFNVNLERTSVDINVTPDKRKIFLTKEKIVLDTLKNSLLKLFESIPRILKIESLANTDVKPEIDQPRIYNFFLQQFSNNTRTDTGTDGEIKQDKDNKGKLELKRKSKSILDFISSKVLKKSVTELSDMPVLSQEMDSKVNIGITLTESNFDSTSEEQARQIDDENILMSVGYYEKNENENKIDINITFDENMAPCKINDTSSTEDSKIEVNSDIKTKVENIMYLESTDMVPNTQIRTVDEVIEERSHTIYCKPKVNKSNSKISKTIEKETSPSKRHQPVTDKEDLGKHDRKTVYLKTSLAHVTLLNNMYIKNKAKSHPIKVKFKSVINPVHNKKCEEELTREISKESFKKMEIIGQFNLGFIITKLDDDLFIIDQHATDEIYNFETLQKTTELTSQKLVIPQQLELTGLNEQILMDNLEVFKKNGFTFQIDENALPTKRIKLLTLPMSKNWIFGKEDIEELLFMLRESPSEYCRPSRVRSMFASRACRKSVMIGTALSKADMRTIVNHMSEIDQPWNCPHGRPTIRHLVNLAMVHTKDM